ncbi:GGDEF domain-containing protein [Oricola thermophila]|uniref:diguanylate cyclase n=1 Tax=Oricola thermophila TaxID=2742145 RepID=A0A6N1V8W0_9HYPH|nr:GGDEF domain-containing protein [Oricola thermophila]QKV17390.1 diguanylate cyclase [Oricola thermophila]
MLSRNPRLADMLERIFIVRSVAEAIRRSIAWCLVIAFIAVILTDPLFAVFFPDLAKTYGPSVRAFAFGIAILVSAPIVALFFRMSLRMVSFNEQLKDMARHDSLTGLLNRAAFEEIIAGRARDSGDDASPEDALIIIDIDHFKSINDTYGHAAGDHVLRMVSVCIAGNVFERDYVARLGGEEFAVLLIGAGASGAVRAAERIRSALEECTSHYEGRVIRVTASLGGALYPRGAAYPSVYRSADFALYRAKDAGRNTCEFNGLPTVPRNPKPGAETLTEDTNRGIA